jgi:toxin-antitoxin system protein
MSITINLTDDELHLIESYAKVHGISVEQALKSSTLETIEDEYDAIIAQEAYNEFLKNPVTYSGDDVWGD